MKSNKALLKSALKSAGFNPEFGDGYLNIARADGVHCEFYGDTDLNYLTATYTVDGLKRELDFWFPTNIELFVETVTKILLSEPVRGRGAR